MPNVPTITPGPNDTEHTPEDAAETLPLITNVHADKQNGRTNDTAEISDEEAYAKLKAKRAERRRKKLIRRGIAAGVVFAIALIVIIATLVINAQPAGTNGPVTDMVTEGTFTTTVEAKGQLSPSRHRSSPLLSTVRLKRSTCRPDRASTRATCS